MRDALCDKPPPTQPIQAIKYAAICQLLDRPSMKIVASSRIR